jgi:hypothetical protein
LAVHILGAERPRSCRSSSLGAAPDIEAWRMALDFADTRAQAVEYVPLW